MISPIEARRIRTKLKLFETEGFDQFLDDLEKYEVEHIELNMFIEDMAEEIKRKYIRELKEFDDGQLKYKQLSIECD